MWGRREDRREGATFDGVSFNGDPREHQGYIATPPILSGFRRFFGLLSGLLVVNFGIRKCFDRVGSLVTRSLRGVV